MKMTGPMLFADAELAQVLEGQLSRVARDAVYAVCAETSRVSKLRLKRTIIEAAQFRGHIELGTPEPITTRPTNRFDDVAARCLVPFSGDPQLLLLSAPAWPALRAVRGRMRDKHLLLEAEAGGSFLPWLPTLFAAEVEAIDRHLDAQDEVVRRYHVDLPAWAATLVDRIYPGLDPAWLRKGNQQAPAGTAVLEELRQRAWAKLLDRLPQATSGASRPVS